MLFRLASSAISRSRSPSDGARNPIDQVSDGCFSTVFDVADNIDLALSNISRAADVCGEEIDKHCAAVEPGEGRIAQCLIDKEAQLASACRAEVAGVKARFAK